MTTDIERIEDAIIPALLSCLLRTHIKINKQDKMLIEALRLCENSVHMSFYKRDPKNKVKLYKNLDKFVEKVGIYVCKEKFCTRKFLLAITGWANSLMEANSVIISEQTYIVLEALAKVINEGYETIENFDKIDNSALNHITNLHKLAQKEGYFI